MSSKENAQNMESANESSNHRVSGDGNLPRPPNSDTQAKLLNKFLNNHEILDNVGSKETRTSHGPDHQTGDSGLPPGSDHHPSQALPDASQQSAEVTSALSADAKEFVPRCKPTFESYSYPDQPCDQDDKFNLSVTAPEFVPHISEEYNFSDNFYQRAPYEEYEEDASDLFEELNDQFDSLYMYDVPTVSSGNSILDHFNQVIDVLSMNPGNMEEYLRPVCDMIRNSSDTTEIANDVAESLFNQSIKEANFRYTGARICQYLNSNLKGNPHFSGFKNILLQKCQKEYNRRDALKAGSPEDQERLRALAMFLAEVFLNVEAEISDGTFQRLHYLPGILIDLVKTLLSEPSDLDVKCSCQLLKLAGGFIEDVVKNSPDDCVKFEEIFTQLQPLQLSNILTENTKFIIGTVLKLKDNDWNRSPSPVKNSGVSYSLEPSNFQVSEPVFYNQSGAPCSRTETGYPDEDDNEEAYVLNEEEEAAFLSWVEEQDQLTEDQGILINDTGYDSYHLDENDDGGMGDEMYAAYEEFLQKPSFLLDYQPHLVGQTHPAIPQTFDYPPPSVPAPQNLNIYQQQHVFIQQQNQIPQQYQQLQQGQQQQQQQHLPHHDQQQYQSQLPGNDRFHYRKL
ncbi:hypothetical protein BsWGS_03022 [Bradybaena similaris]